jgi:hypothetical protein
VQRASLINFWTVISMMIRLLEDFFLSQSFVLLTLPGFPVEALGHSAAHFPGFLLYSRDNLSHLDLALVVLVLKLVTCTIPLTLTSICCFC